MAFFRDPQTRLGVVLMSQPRHAYAFSTRYFANKPEDRLTTYVRLIFRSSAPTYSPATCIR